MEYKTFGKTGQQVSRLGFGGATADLKNYLKPFDPDLPTDREPIIEAIHLALEKGINYCNYFDNVTVHSLILNWYIVNFYS